MLRTPNGGVRCLIVPHLTRQMPRDNVPALDTIHYPVAYRRKGADSTFHSAVHALAIDTSDNSNRFACTFHFGLTFLLPVLGIETHQSNNHQCIPLNEIQREIHLQDSISNRSSKLQQKIIQAIRTGTVKQVKK